MLEVRDDEGVIGTIDLVDGTLVADPETLLRLLPTRPALNDTEAYTELDGWSNGWVWIAAV
jgi:hypothetical protein